MYSAATDWATPIPRPASSVRPKDETLAKTAGASPAMRSETIRLLCKLDVGTTSIHATPDSAPPKTQFAAPMLSTDLPTAAAAVGFSATAPASAPNVEYL